VGYRVKEVIFGQATEGVGRTSAVEGSVVIDGTAVTSADFVVQLATIVSDSDRRDGQFNSRIMDTAAHPTATFSLTSPISLPPDAATGAAVDATATGDLTLRGTTKSVTFPVSARLEGASVKITGTIPVVFAEWSIPNPSFGGITTEDNGDLEFLLVLAR
jgi:polyisoprenoid-binding protein YceI